MWRLFLTLVISFSLPGTKPSIESFKHEAEKAIGKPIQIVSYDVASPEGGNTDCNLYPVLIRVGSHFSAEIRREILAPELGHVIVCSHGFRPWTYLSSSAPDKIKPILGGMTSLLSSCYIDPLANAEAERRGFNVGRLKAMGPDVMKKFSKDEIHKMVNQLGMVSQNYSALSIYCMEVSSKRKLPGLEDTFVNEQDVLARLESLKSRIGAPSCSDVDSCYFWTKKLCDEFSWASWIQLKNPTTGRME